MKSLTKVDLTAEQLEKAVQAGLGPEAVIAFHEEFHEGWFNTIHGIELRDGRRLVLKTAPKSGVPVLRHEVNLLDTEVSVYRLLGGTEVPTPRVHFYEPSGVVLGLPFFLMDWIKLPTYAKAREGMSPEDQRSVVRNLGALNAALNAVAGPAFGSLREEGFRSRLWSEAFAHLVEGTLADGRDRNSVLAVSPEAVRAALAKHRTALDEAAEPRLVHWDLHDSNIFVEGTRIRAVIDADRSQWADPLMEIYYAPFFDGGSFVEGYGSDLRKGRGAAVRRALYDVHLGLIMTIESDYRGFDSGHRQWASDFLAQSWQRLEQI